MIWVVAFWSRLPCSFHRPSVEKITGRSQRQKSAKRACNVRSATERSAVKIFPQAPRGSSSRNRIRLSAPSAVGRVARHGSQELSQQQLTLLPWPVNVCRPLADEKRKQGVVTDPPGDLCSALVVPTCVNFPRFYTPHLQATGSRYVGTLWIRQPTQDRTWNRQLGWVTARHINRTREDQAISAPGCPSA